MRALLLAIMVALTSIAAVADSSASLLACSVLLAIDDDEVAHGGGLNACGCHHNRKTGECHCHQPRGCGCPCQPSTCR